MIGIKQISGYSACCPGFRICHEHSGFFGKIRKVGRPDKVNLFKKLIIECIRD